MVIRMRTSLELRDEIMEVRHLVLAVVLYCCCVAVLPRLKVSFNWRDRNLEGDTEADGAEEGAASLGDVTSDFYVPNLQHLLPHLSASSSALRPALLVSKGRRGVLSVFGVHADDWHSGDSVLDTLQSLLGSMTTEDKNASLIVLLIAETDLTVVASLSKKVKQRFHDDVTSGLLEIISPPSSFYLEPSSVPPSYDHALVPGSWKFKVTLDVVYLMMYARNRGKYYVQIMDSVVSEPHLVTRIKEAVKEHQNEKRHWLILDVCPLPLTGKVFQDEDLPKIVSFLLLFYQEKPVDQLLHHMVHATICIPYVIRSERCRQQVAKFWIRSPVALFHPPNRSTTQDHVTRLSPKEKPPFVPHSNPAAVASASMRAYNVHGIANAYKNRNFYWNLQLRKGDTVTFRFTPPIRVRQVVISGSPYHPQDRFRNTSVEVSVTRRLSDVNRTSDGFYAVGCFRETKTSFQAHLPIKIGVVKALRLRVHADLLHGGVVREILIVKWHINDVAAALRMRFFGRSSGTTSPEPELN